MIEFHELQQQFTGAAQALLPYMYDEKTTDVFVQGREVAYVEQHGSMIEIPNPFATESDLSRWIERLILPTGRSIDANRPYLDGTLVDGSRLHLVLPPLSPRGATISIRKFLRGVPLGLGDFASQSLLEQIQRRVEERANILIVGSTGSGKTTFLRLLLELVPQTERIIGIEEVEELRPKHRHWVPLVTKPATPDGGCEIGLQALLRNALRMRPERVIVGECRGPEAFEMLQAMNTGHSGSMTTLHGNGIRDGLTRLEGLVCSAGHGIVPAIARLWVSLGIGLVIHLVRKKSGRQIAGVAELRGMEGDQIRLLPWF